MLQQEVGKLEITKGERVNREEVAVRVVSAGWGFFV